MTMTPEDEELHRIEAQGWRQGCVLPVACHAEVAQLPELDTMLGPDDACIVVSQTCDEENISLAALRYLLRWEEFDYVSYQDRTAHQPPYPGMG
jgi:hypothetical protein